MDIQQENLVDVYDTLLQNMKDKTRRDYSNRLKHIVEFQRTDFLEYYSIDVREVSEDEINDDIFLLQG